MAEIRWTKLATEDLDDIYAFIAKDSVYYALQTIERFFERVQVLSEYPEIGRVVPEFSDYSIRELIEGNYRIVYQIKSGTIFIARVHHAARDIGSQRIF